MSATSKPDNSVTPTASISVEEKTVVIEDTLQKKKMWGSTSSLTTGRAATSLASIMAQEEAEAKINQAEKEMKEREETQLRLAMEASIDGMDEHMRLAMALSLQESKPEASVSDSSVPVTGPAVATVSSDSGLTPEELELIEKALQDADKALVNEDESLSLAIRLQNEEQAMSRKRAGTNGDSHVRIMTQQELWQEQANSKHSLYANDNYDDEEDFEEAGFRMNSTTPSKQWSRLDRATIVGPNQEVRTKHDVHLASQANAHRLGLMDDAPRFVGNRAYNSFKQSMKRSTHKGVAAHGHGRAATDVDKTKQGGMDSRVRTQIAKAINSGLIEMCNGVVKEGKEAIVYHANEGAESGGFDVAIKVFKRIQEFKQRFSYVEGDPRYIDRKFSNASSREQLEIWAEKEFRNLSRANRAGVPVPTPLFQKENILLMRFLGEDGWPSPQLRELDLKKGSKKYRALYNQTMEAVRRLYNKGRLVHGDLSEYNVLVCPSQLVENRHSENTGDELEVQIVLIDFAQSVDRGHPSSLEFLQRDILRVKEFFDKMGVKTMSTTAAEDYVLSWDTETDDCGTKGSEEEKVAPKENRTASFELQRVDDSEQKPESSATAPRADDKSNSMMEEKGTVVG